MKPKLSLFLLMLFLAMPFFLFSQEPTWVDSWQEHFDAAVDTNFWANLAGENNITGTAENGAFKYVCNPNNSYRSGVMWDFPSIGYVLTLYERPFISFMVKVETGATYDGTDMIIDSQLVGTGNFLNSIYKCEKELL